MAVLVWVLVECALARRGAEVERLAFMLGLELRRLLVHLHSTDWVLHHGYL